jgi:HPr kinase/phosphorylase
MVNDLEHNLPTAHGVALNVYNNGLLISGNNGMGKSELGLSLIARGHKFIADDLVSVSRIDNSIIISPPTEDAVMYLRGLGFIAINHIYGPAACLPESKLDLIIELVDNKAAPTDPLQQLKNSATILGVPIPKFQLPLGTNRPLTILIELIVKYQQQCQAGYDSHQTFIDNHLNLLKV